ncbi:MAG: hypothetical protein A4E35_02435 [Methanoregula sp. PtaU1.Bin051]|nr:MAG: hypothetical protein A4E35_02435 [Methanoregula sp. PtaU1.Bin051]
MNAKYILIILVVAALVAASGCTGTRTGTQAGAGSSSGTQATQEGISLTPGPTDVMPDYNVVTVDVGEKDYLGRIPVIFQGGMGLVHTKKVEAKVTRIDGTTETKTIGTNKGDEAVLQGTRGEPGLRGQADRVEVWVTMDTGKTYKIVDVIREYRTRG